MPTYKMIPEIMMIILPTIKKTKEIELKISENPPIEKKSTPTKIKRPFIFTIGSSNSLEFLANTAADIIRITFKKMMYDNTNHSYSESTILTIVPIKEGWIISKVKKIISNMIVCITYNESTIFCCFLNISSESVNNQKNSAQGREGIPTAK